MGIAAAALVFVLLAIGTALTKRPWCDEAWFASPALDLALNGRMGTHVLEPTGNWISVNNRGANLKRIDQRTYWVFPLHLLVLAAWFKIFGFSVTVLRLPAIGWGMMALAAWWVIVRRLGGSRELALLAIFLIGIDSAFVDFGSDGRMDMMCAALGYAGMAAYLALRETNFRLAVIAGHSAAALACFTHPNGALASAAILFMIVYLDRKQFGWLTLPVSGIPYLVAALGWSLYIAQDPEAFRAQFGANLLGRTTGLTTPLQGLWDEIRVRYLESHFLPAGAGAFSFIKVFVLVAYLGAVVLAIAVPALRRQPGCRLLLYLTGLRFVIMGLGVSWKGDMYLVNVLPFYGAILAFALAWLWQHPGQLRWAAAAIFCVVFSVQMIWNLHRIVRYRPYQTKYQPAMAFLKEHMTPQDLVFGSAELGFAFGFYNPQITDDLWLGRWTGKQPTIIVADKWRYYRNLISHKQLPAYTDYVTEVMQHYHPIYSQDEGYLIFARN
jgi:hypothetical protein